MSSSCSSSSSSSSSSNNNSNNNNNLHGNGSRNTNSHSLCDAVLDSVLRPRQLTKLQGSKRRQMDYDMLSERNSSTSHTDWIDSAKSPMKRFYEHGIESSGFLKVGNFSTSWTYGSAHTYTHFNYMKPCCILPYSRLSFAKFGWV